MVGSTFASPVYIDSHQILDLLFVFGKVFPETRENLHEECDGNMGITCFYRSI
jgi:hypothetical protein